jgi:cytoskeleton protein RodZ
VQLRARGDSWVQVRDTRANQVILDRVLRDGDTFQVPSREGLVLTTGKAENLEILLNDEPSPVLSGATGVRRGIVLDVDRLRQPETAAPRAAEGQPPPRP